MPHAFCQPARHLPQLDHLVLHSILIGHPCFEQAESNPERGQLLADVVVQVASDLGPLGLLGQHQPMGE